MKPAGGTPRPRAVRDRPETAAEAIARGRRLLGSERSESAAAAAVPLLRNALRESVVAVRHHYRFLPHSSSPVAAAAAAAQQQQQQQQHSVPGPTEYFIQVYCPDISHA